jgi:chorismate mutase/prephenate dehydratase
MWEYVFYVDIEGHAHSTHVAAAIKEIEDRASYLKHLGSYPVAVI